MADPNTTPDGSRGQELSHGHVITSPAHDRYISPDDIAAIQISDADLKAFERNGRYFRLGSEWYADKDKDALLSKAATEIARRMGFAQTPPIFMADTNRTEGAWSGETKEGSPYIVVSKEFMKTFPPEQQQAIIALELDRLKHRDESPAMMAAGLNDARIDDQNTYRADRDASGQLGTCHPEVLAAAILAMDELRRKALIAAGEPHPGPDSGHPYAGLRIERLEEQRAEQDASGVCRGR